MIIEFNVFTVHSDTDDALADERTGYVLGLQGFEDFGVLP